MKAISLKQLKEKYEALIQHKVSREEVSNWAGELCEAEDEDHLEYLPKEAEDQLWKGLDYLHGFDLAGHETKYLLSLEDLKLYFQDHVWA